MEKLVCSGDFSPRVLSEFRSAVDNVRQTAWAVQQWLERKEQHRDPYTVLGILAQERVRRATQIANDLRLDLESLEVGFETAGLADLFQAIDKLRERPCAGFQENLGKWQLLNRPAFVMSAMPHARSHPEGAYGKLMNARNLKCTSGGESVTR